MSKIIDRLFYRARKIQAFFVANSFGGCGRNLIIWGPCQIKNPKKIFAGHNLSINDYVYINALGGVNIGNDVSLSAGCKIISTKLDKNAHPFNSRHVSESINIGNNVQIGAGAILLPGLSIGSNVIVGAGSIVTKDLPSNVIAVGNPIRILSSIDRNE